MKEGCLAKCRLNVQYSIDAVRTWATVRKQPFEVNKWRKMNQFELWLKACEEMGTIIFELERSDRGAMYKTWNEYLSGNNYFRTDPVYQVWKDNRRVYCGLNLQYAYSAWRGA